LELASGARRRREEPRSALPYYPSLLRTKTENFFFSEGISVSHLFPQKGRRARPRPAPPHDSVKGSYLGIFRGKQTAERTEL
jgi:hypothetical protein